MLHMYVRAVVEQQSIIWSGGRQSSHAGSQAAWGQVGPRTVAVW